MLQYNSADTQIYQCGAEHKLCFILNIPVFFCLLTVFIGKILCLKLFLKSLMSDLKQKRYCFCFKGQHYCSLHRKFNMRDQKWGKTVLNHIKKNGICKDVQFSAGRRHRNVQSQIFPCTLCKMKISKCCTVKCIYYVDRVCLCVCVCIYIYIYICMSTYIFALLFFFSFYLERRINSYPVLSTPAVMKTVLSYPPAFSYESICNIFQFFH